MKPLPIPDPSYFLFSLVDPIPTSVMESVSPKFDQTHRTCPIYIVVMHTGTVLSTIIQRVTKDTWSHCGISFDSSLTTMYTFGRKKLNPENPLDDTGFTIEDVHGEIFEQFKTKYAVYGLFVTPYERALMQERLRYFVEEGDRLKYNLGGLVLNFFHIKSDNDTKFFCSGFVADILDSSGRNLSEKSAPSLTRPQDLAELESVTLLETGDDFSKYNSSIVRRKIQTMQRKMYLEQKERRNA